MKQAIINQIKASHGIILGAHANPDGDAVGALIGMATLCDFLHMPYQILLEKVPTDFSGLLSEVVVASKPTIAYDTFISVDCGDKGRLGIYENAFDSAVHTINIDHHSTNTYFAELNEVRSCAASCELIFELIEFARCPLTPHLAASLYTGLLTDTGGFMHASTTPSTHEVVAKLLACPFDFTKVYYEQMYATSERAVRMESIAISHMKKLENIPCYMAYVTLEEMEMVGAGKEELGNIVSKIKNIRGCEIAVFLYPLDDSHYKVSFRSNAPFDVASLASIFGGGGHVRAAGATLGGSLEVVYAQIEDAVKALIMKG